MVVRCGRRIAVLAAGGLLQREVVNVLVVGGAMVRFSLRTVATGNRGLDAS